MALVGLAHETFTLTLDKVLKQTDPPHPTSLQCEFSYYYNFPRKQGAATLISVNGARLGQMAQTGDLAFASADMNEVNIASGGAEGEKLYISRTVLKLGGGARYAAVVLGRDGGTVLATSNWPDDLEIPE
jgi:hypothetical protein